MKILKKIITTIFLIIYIPIVLFLTICLLNYNDYNVTVFGKNSLLVIEDDLEGFKAGDLAIVKKNNNDEIKEGDNIFFYEATSVTTKISYAKVESVKEVSREKTTYIIEGDYEVSSDFVIGKQATSKKYEGLGSVLSVLESRWGFLMIIIFPILLLFIYEIYMLINEVKK